MHMAAGLSICTVAVYTLNFKFDFNHFGKGVIRGLCSMTLLIWKILSMLVLMVHLINRIIE